MWNHLRGLPAAWAAAGRAVVRAALLSSLLAGCTDSAGRMPLDLPSAHERVFAEKRDVVVAGYFDPPLDRPGDVRIELFRGEAGRWTRVRLIESHVDPSTGVTSRDALDFGYPEGQAWGPEGAVTDPAQMVMTPDLVALPGGIEDPTNKVVVTRDYYAGVILGGASRTFDTTYVGDDGLPMADLDAGTYTILVTGLSGELKGRTSSMRIEFGRTHAMLGRFSPADHRERMLEHAAALGYRTYIDFFPGFFAHQGSSYEIPGRWMANNSVEVVNTFADVVVDTAATAENDVILYNISAASATQLIEIGAIVANGLLTRQTTFHRYDIGEPFIAYTDAGGRTVSLDGVIVAFHDGERLALTRVESMPDDGIDRENLYDVGDPAPLDIDVDIADGVEVPSAWEFSVYGVVVPVPSPARPGPLPHQHEIDDAIRSVRYAVRDATGATVADEVRAVGLERRFEPNRAASSIYEFRHEFHVAGPGSYVVEAVGLDSGGAPVPGAEAAFSLSIAE